MERWPEVRLNLRFKKPNISVEIYKHYTIFVDREADLLFAMNWIEGVSRYKRLNQN